MGESVLTRAFARVDGALACEGVPLSTIAQAVGTPTYVYSANAVREQYTRLAAALHGPNGPTAALRQWRDGASREYTVDPKVAAATAQLGARVPSPSPVPVG